ncbi:MAG TPA: hemerythrin domain-containing protein [Candidatus Binataceae bacterium]|nr:hemerythrin domain-containing protein [Candidatus Binataceae bacterium]
MLVSEFVESFRDEHRQLLGTLLALRDALESGDTERAQEGIGELIAAAGPHLFYEGEALYPALAGLYGDEYVSRLQAEHENTLAAALDLAELADMVESSHDAAERALELVSELLPHVSERDGLAVVVEVLPEEQVGAIAEAREHARKRGVTIHEAAKGRARRGRAKRAASRVAAKARVRKKPAVKPKAAKRIPVKVAGKKRGR